jgi:DNA-binding MarR family transcriptional regulator
MAAREKSLKKLVKPTPEIGLGVLLRRTNKAFAEAISANLAEYGITHSQFHHLRRLWERDGMSSSELSALVEVKRATSTSILDALEARKLIRRVRNDPDRRKVNVFLTEAGKALESQLTECARRANRQAAKYLTQPERAMLYVLLGQVNRGLNER